MCVSPKLGSLCAGQLSVRLLMLLVLSQTTVAGWQNNLPPRRYVRLDPSDTFRFHGNHTGGDLFRLLYRDEVSLVIGARGAAYNISLSNLQQLSRLDWESNRSDAELCNLKGKPESLCHNFIRVFARSDTGVLMVCGTNAYDPRCRNYTATASGYVRSEQREISGAGICPYSPVHNSTSCYTDGGLYAGTVADFSGKEALILRDTIRTGKWDKVVLNDPQFVNSFSMGDHVYFLFREIAVEHNDCGKRVYSRVARVCKNDRGGVNQYKSSWTSYMKARLNCSVPGSFPFYFDGIQASTDVVGSGYLAGGEGTGVIYTVFTTDPNAIAGSAVCAFSVRAIRDAFDGAFQERVSLDSNWRLVPDGKVPEPRPGLCVNNSHALSDSAIDFVRNHPLMYDVVPSLFDAPLLTRVSTSYRFSAITVDPRVRTAGIGETNSQRYVDVIFIGTDNGRVIKMFNAHFNKVHPVVIEEIQVFSSNEPIRDLHISRLGEPKLVVSSDSQLVMLPLHRCYTNKITVCGECVALQDPYCAWDLRRQRCTYVGNQRFTGPDYVQNVQLAVSHRCPEGVSGRSRDAKVLEPIRSDGAHVPDLGGDRSLYTDLSASGIGQQSVAHYDQGGSAGAGSVPSVSGGGGGGAGGGAPSVVQQQQRRAYSGQLLVAALVATALVALLVGFLVSHCCARRCQQLPPGTAPGTVRGGSGGGGCCCCSCWPGKSGDINLPYADTDYTYFDQRHSAANNSTRLAHEQNLLSSDEVTYSEPVLIPTNSMMSTLKKSQATIPLQHTADKYDTGNGNCMSMRGDKNMTHRPIRAQRPPIHDDTVLAEEMLRREASLRRDGVQLMSEPGYATTRSVRRVYL